MERPLTFMTCVCYLAFCVTAIQIYNGEKASLENVYDMCNSVAIHRAISGSPDKLSDLLLNLRNANDVNEFLFALSQSDNDFGEMIGKELNIVGKDSQLGEIMNTVNDLHKACLVEYISGKRSSDNIQKEAQQYQAFDFDNLKRKDFISTKSGRLTESLKRNQVIGLNPTGWRKRRSDQRDPETEDLTKFIRNMRELLEKREKLSFNPTGW